MKNREASSHCSPLYSVAGSRDTSLSQTHSDIIPLKWAKILVLCTPNESPGVPFDYGNEHMLLWDFRERILRENGRWSSCPLNLMLHYIRDILCTSVDSLCPYRADCFVLAQTQLTGAVGLCCWGWQVACGGCWLFLAAAMPVVEFLAPPTTVRLDETSHSRA